MFMYTDYNQHLLDNVKKIHFIGCGGSGMYPLIQILAAKGYEISGSDVLDGSIIRYEREMGVKVSLGHSADNVIGTDMVVYSAAISKDNVELNAAASYGIPTIERSVLLGYVSRLYRQSICVSGTHGKTTTTSMITTALELAGRRFEVYGECNGALVIDDYAHHPTELRATLNTAKEMGYKRLIAVHQPFTYSRTKMLFNDFVDVLKIPDITVLTPIMGSREPNDPTITSAKLAAQIPGSVLVDSLQAAADWVKQNAQPGDLVITLGCGDIYKASKMMVADNQ